MARFPHGLLVVSAPGSVDAHDDWDPATEAIHAGPDSLYISVQSAASGLVDVACVKGPYVPSEIDLLFSGELSLPEESLALYDPDGVVQMQLPVDGSCHRVEIYGDHEDESSELLIVLTAVDGVG
ncbi:hypothetical protein [Streptomyces sp. 7N604]|uniref:hypothetical protein n=1 Tax=Streptomyces sp. 7N604 TaxID=3457415 RepID=UPI003FD5E8B5